jgi:hypothetical protein
MATTTQSAASSVANFAKEFGVIGKIFGFIIEKLGFTVAQGITDLSKAFSAYSDVAKQGATGAKGLTQFIEQASKLGYSVDKLNQFSTLVGQNSEILAQFGVGVLDGVEKIAKISDEFTKSGFRGELFAMGQQLEDVNNGIARYARLLAITGQQHRLDQNQLTAGAKAYIKELDLMSKLTGKNAQTIQAEREARLRDERLLAAQIASQEEEDELRAAKRYAEADVIKALRENKQQLLDIVPPNLQAEFGALFEGLITGPQMASLMQFLPNTLRYIQEGGRDVVEFSRLVNSEGKKILGKDGIGGSAMAANQFFEAFKISAVDFNDLINRTSQILKGIPVKDLPKITDPLTKATAHLEDTFILLQQSLQKLVKEGVEPIVKAFGENVKLLEKARLTVPPYPFGPPPPPNVPPATPEQKKLQSAGGFSVNSSPTGLTKEPPVSPATNEPSAPGGPAPVKAPSPPAQPPAGAPASQTPPTDPLARFNFGGQRAERTGGGEASAKLIEMAGKVADLYPDLMITAFDDLFHRRRFPDSAHTKGRAMDFALIGDNRPRNIEESTAIKKMLQDMGLINVRDEYFADKDKNTTGPHFHAEVSARFGRLTSGPLSGYRATLHGNEVVIPLSNGTTIPLDMTPLIRNLDSNAQALAAQITRLDDLIMLSRDTLNVNRKMLSYRT